MLLVAGVGCGSDSPPAGESSPPGPESTASAGPAGPAADKAAPRWEEVAAFKGTGDVRTTAFAIDAAALQWRVTVTCTDGTVGVALDGDEGPLAELDRCPGSTFGFSIRTGPATLAVDATGTWEVVVDQQLDTAVAEPALAGMVDAARVAHGDFYGIDQKGSGTAALYDLPGGGIALRFDPFLVTRNSDLFVWVSEAPAPRTSEEARRTPHVQIDRLTATAGAQNYVLPETVDRERVRSVVVWCEPVQTAYAAASLLP
ncbi:MAG: hypothetical protein QOE93_792 [Actinomycetota bacterium]|nr:hypothetical protein [Actinomycetota bacterium]